MQLHNTEFQQVDRNNRNRYAEPHSGAAEVDLLEVEAGQKQRDDNRQEQSDNAEQDHPDNSGRSCKSHFYRLVFAVNAAEEDRRNGFPFQNLVALDQFASLPVEGRIPGSVDLSARLNREAVSGSVAVITE